MGRSLTCRRSLWVLASVLVVTLMTWPSADAAFRRRLQDANTVDVTVVAFVDPPFINLLPTDLAPDRNGAVGVVSSGDLRDHRIAMPKYGYALAVMDLVALRANVSYKFNLSDTGIADLCQYVSAAPSGTVVALVPLPREDQIDYINPCDSNPQLKRIPLYDSGLVMMVRLTSFSDSQASPGSAFFTALGSPSAINAMCVFILGIFLSGHIMWFIERKHPSGHFPNSYLRGLDDACWWSSQTCTTVGYGDKVPQTTWGRFFAFLWAISGLLMIAFFTGTITSQMTLLTAPNNIQGVADITVATAVGVEQAVWNTTMAVLDGTGAKFVMCGQGNDITQCGTLLRDGTVDAVIGDYPTIVNYISSTDALANEFDIIGDMFNEGNVYDYNMVVNTADVSGESVYSLLMVTLEGLEGGASFARITSHYFGDAKRRSIVAARKNVSSQSQQNYSWWLIILTITIIVAFMTINIFYGFKDKVEVGDINIESWPRWAQKIFEPSGDKQLMLGDQSSKRVEMEVARSSLRPPSMPDSAAPQPVALNGGFAAVTPTHYTLD